MMIRPSTQASAVTGCLYTFGLMWSINQITVSHKVYSYCNVMTAEAVLPFNEVFCKKTNGTFAADDSVVNVIIDWCTC